MEEEINWPIPLKPKSEYQYVGKEIKREDTKDMILGKGIFVQDLKFPGMLYARILRPQNYHSQLLHFDHEGFEKEVSREIKTIVDGSFIGLLAKNTHEANKALYTLRTFTQWSKPSVFPIQKDLEKYIRNIF